MQHHHILERIQHLMSKFLDDLHAEITKIVTNPPSGLSADDLAAHINEAVAVKLAPIADRLGDVETGLMDLAKKEAGDDVGNASSASAGTAPSAPAEVGDAPALSSGDSQSPAEEHATGNID